MNCNLVTIGKAGLFALGLVACGVVPAAAQHLVTKALKRMDEEEERREEEEKEEE